MRVCMVFNCLLVMLAVALVSSCASPELGNWNLFGKGFCSVQGGDLLLEEDIGSKGVMLISPELMVDDVLLSFEVKALNKDTVLVALLALSDSGENSGISPPAGYDGGIEWLFEDTDGYFVAFCNKPHNRKPFIRKLPTEKGSGELAEAEVNAMAAGQWYKIETGKKEGRVFLKIDGKTIVEATDPHWLKRGHLGIRIRGTKNGLAQCRIRNWSVLASED